MTKYYIVGKRNRAGKVDKFIASADGGVIQLGGFRLTKDAVLARLIEHRADAERLAGLLPGEGWAVFTKSPEGRKPNAPTW